VQTITQALSVVSNEGYENTATIFLAAGTYPTPNGTLFNGTPFGTHTGPVTIQGTSNATALWCSTVATAPTITAPSPLYGFTSNGTIPADTTDSPINYYAGMTLTLTGGLDSGVSYSIASTSGNFALVLAYDATLGPAPQFTTNDAFCVYSAPESILQGSTDNAIWQSTNGFAHTLQNVQVQAATVGQGRLQWQGLNWALNNVWLTGLYSPGTGINVTASGGCALEAGMVVGLTRQGLRLGVAPPSNFANTTIDVAQSKLLLSSGSTALLENSVFRAASIEFDGPSTGTLKASLFWGNSAIVTSGSSAISTTDGVYATARTDVATSSYFQYLVSGGAVAVTTACYFTGPNSCSSGCPAALVTIGGNWTATATTLTTTGTTSTAALVQTGASASFTNGAITGGNTNVAILVQSTMTLAGVVVTSTSASSALSVTAGSCVISNSTINGASFAANVLSLSGGTVTIDTTLIENVASANSAVAVSGATVTLNGVGTVLHPSAGAALVVSSSGSAVVNNITITAGSGADTVQCSGSGTLTIFGTSVTATAAHQVLTNSGGTVNVTGCTLDGGAQSASVVLLTGGTTNIDGTSTLRNCAGGGSNALVRSNSGSAVANIGPGTTMSLVGSCEVANVLGGGPITLTNVTVSGSSSVVTMHVGGGTLVLVDVAITQTAAQNAITLSSGTLNVTGSTINGASQASDVLSLTGGTANIGTTLIENVGVSNNLITMPSGSPTLSLGPGSALTPTAGVALNAAAGSATLTNVTVTGGSGSYGITAAGATVSLVNTGVTLTSAHIGIYLSAGSVTANGGTVIDGGGFATNGVFQSAGTFTSNGATLTHIGNNALFSFSGGTAQMNAGTIMTPGVGYAIVGNTGGGTVTLTNATITGGSTRNAVDITSTTVTITESSITLTGAHDAVNVNSGKVTIIGSTIDGGGLVGIGVSNSGGTVTITGGTVIQHFGHLGVGIDSFGGTMVVNGSTVVQNCGTTTSDAAITVTGGSFTANTVTIGPNAGDGIFVSGASPTISNLASPSGQPNGGYGVHLSASTTTSELTGTNTNLVGSTAAVSVCGTSETWAAV
jgi:hypothetical protein